MSTEKLSNEEREFIMAATENELEEFALDDEEEYILYTDEEEDGDFFPSVTILHTVTDKDEELQIVNELLEDIDWFTYSELDSVIEHNTGDVYSVYFSPDADVKEEVVED